MRGKLIERLTVAIVAMAALSACRGGRELREGPSANDPDVLAQIRRSEQAGMERQAEDECERRTVIYLGSITVNSSDYMHTVALGDDFVDQPIDGPDRLLSNSAQVRFTLVYPFDRPFAGVVTGPVTLRRTIDAIRAGFRQMYEGTTERDIPGMQNKDLTGPYGHAYHVIDDLVIERIDLCADNTFSIGIGS